MPLALVRARPGPYFDQVSHLVPDRIRTKSSRISLESASRRFGRWLASRGDPPLTREIFQDYRAFLVAEGLAPATVNLKLCMVRAILLEARDRGLLDPLLVQRITSVSGVPNRGVRTGRWLSAPQATALLRAPGTDSLVGIRDTAILALLLGGGLRRLEIARLRCEHLAQLDGRPVILNLVSKYGKVRTIPLPDWTMAAVNAWRRAADIADGPLFVRMHRYGVIVGGRLQGFTVYQIVRHAAAKAGLEIAPHDLRRTHARLSFEGGAPLEQLRLTLGHDSVQTTEQYVGARLNLKQAPCDYLPDFNA